jgi:hypothetical protein
MVKQNKNLTSDRLTSLFFYLAILFFFIGFQFSDTMLNGWYQQFMPSIGGRQITDITFTDSLNGYAITSEVSDTSFILKTTNSGDNWFLSHFDTGICSYYNVQFINQSTGFVSGYIYDGSLFKIVKTTNAGLNWFYINAPFDIIAFDMFVLNEDSIWIVDAGGLTGGVFRTTNGGASWDRQLNLGSQNPSKIYMYNARIGFVSSTAGLYKTTNGENWTFASNDFSFSDMFMMDSLTGWKASGFIKKTTDGGLNWINQTIPTGGSILGSGALEFMNKDNDTIWTLGESIITGGSPNTRGILFRTINSGNNWLFQLPDTSIHITRYFNGQFVNDKIGWAYQINGIHTTTGGNDTFYTNIEQISSNVPKEFKLFQNYPNPFNPVTYINYELKITNYVVLRIFDITGKRITDLVNQKQNTGSYKITFDGTDYSSGVYFYSLIVDGKLVDTKKMILLK